MPHSRYCLSLLLTFGFACDRTETKTETTPTAKTETKAETKAKTESKTETKTESKPKAGRERLTKAPPITKEQRKEAAALVYKGRTLSKDKKIDEALIAFEAAMKADPQSARAACEAGYAALRLDKLDVAQRHLDAGLRLVQQPNREAACRYNLGLVAQKRGQTERAVEHFKHSLALRDNKTVRAKLATLAPKGTCLPPERIIDETKPFCGLPDDYWECGTDEDGVPALEGLEIVDDFSDPTPLGDKLVLKAGSSFFGEVRMRFDLILEESGQRTLLAKLGWTTETEGSTSVKSVKYAHVQLVPGGPTEVVVTVEEDWERDMIADLMHECEGDYEYDSPQFEKCYGDGPDKDIETGTDTYFFGCGQLEGRWVCERTDTEPKTESDFMALFRCS